MRHDSYIACHDTVLLPSRDELVDGLIEGSIDHVGSLAQALFGAVVAAASGSQTIAARDAELIAAALGPPLRR